MKGVKIKTERVLLFVRSSGDRLCSHLHAAFLAVKAQILFSKTFSHDNTAPERQTGFYISRNLQQQRLLTVVPPQGQTSTLRPLSTILFGLVHSLVLQWEKQGNQKEVRLCKKKEIKYLTFTSAQLSVRVCVFYFIPVLSMCRLSGTQQARRCWSWSSRRGGWGTSSAGPCSPPSHLRFEKWDTSCREGGESWGGGGGGKHGC